MKITRQQLRKIILQEMALSSRPDRQRPPTNPDDFDYSQMEETDLVWVPGKYGVQLVEERRGRYRLDIYIGQPNGHMLYSGGFPKKRALFASREEAISFYKSPTFSRILSKLRSIG